MKLRSGIYTSILWLVPSITLGVQMHSFTPEEIIGMSIHDEHPDATLGNMRIDMLGLYHKLMLRREKHFELSGKESVNNAH